MLVDLSKVPTADYKDLVGLVFRQVPVPILEFIESRNYLNRGKEYLYPRIKDILIRLFDTTIREAYVNVGRGGGKSELATNFHLYNLYWLMNLINPHSFYELSEKTLISLINVGISIDQANSVIFDNIGAIIEGSPYFAGSYKLRKRDIYFPGRRIRAVSGHSGSTAWRGYHIFSGVLDEINFFLDKKGKSNSERMYGVLKGSMSTRFPWGYKMLCISSTDHDDDFLSRQRKFMQNNGAAVYDLP